MEHNPETCLVCQDTGDWANTPDTERFLEAHQKNGYEFRVDGGRLIELLAPARPCRQFVPTQ